MKTRACRERGGEEEPRIQLPSLDLVCLGQRGRRGRREGQSPRGNHESADHVARMAMICAPPLWPAMRYTLSLRGVVCSAVCSREIARAERKEHKSWCSASARVWKRRRFGTNPHLQGARLRAMSINKNQTNCPNHLCSRSVASDARARLRPAGAAAGSGQKDAVREGLFGAFAASASSSTRR